MKFTFKTTIFSCFLAFIVQATINTFVPLLFVTFQNTFGIPLEKITMLIAVNFLVQLTVDLISSKTVDRIGYRPCVVTAHIASAAGLIF